MYIVCIKMQYRFWVFILDLNPYILFLAYVYYERSCHWLWWSCILGKLVRYGSASERLYNSVYQAYDNIARPYMSAHCCSVFWFVMSQEHEKFNAWFWDWLLRAMRWFRALQASFNPEQPVVYYFINDLGFKSGGFSIKQMCEQKKIWFGIFFLNLYLQNQL
jgi:hypothetical protein